MIWGFKVPDTISRYLECMGEIGGWGFSKVIIFHFFYMWGGIDFFSFQFFFVCFKNANTKIIEYN